MITIKNLSLLLKKKNILDDISLTISQGSLHCLIGHSGAGKTSLLQCIAGLQQGYTGLIEHQGSSIKMMQPIQRAHAIGFVFQQFNLFPHMTVLENCTHPMTHVLKMSIQEAHDQALTVLESVGMIEYKNNYPHQLSGGQQQRVAIARALGMGPKILLFDEPTSALDPHSRNNIKSMLKELNKQGITIVISSHDMAFVKAIDGVIHFIEQGKLIESGVTWEQSNKISSFLNQGL